MLKYQMGEGSNPGVCTFCKNSLKILAVLKLVIYVILLFAANVPEPEMIKKSPRPNRFLVVW